MAGSYPTSTGEAELLADPTDPARWTLLVNGVPSSPVRLDDPTVLEFEYLRWMADVIDVAWPERAPLDVVHLGAAACSLARYVEATRPRSTQVAVEVDSELARLVRSWFALPRSPRLRIQVADAREGLARRRDASAHLVVRDVFSGDTTPRHLTTSEFVTDASRVLTDDGVYLANVADSPPLDLLRAELATLVGVFGHTTLVTETALLRGRRYANAVLIGSRRPLPLGDLGRRVSSGAAVARLVHGQRLADLARAAIPRRDPGVRPGGTDDAVPGCAP